MQTILVTSDTTLFHVAASQLGDATAWSRIATLNGLTDPMVKAASILVIPLAEVATTPGIAV